MRWISYNSDVSIDILGATFFTKVALSIFIAWELLKWIIGSKPLEICAFLAIKLEVFTI